MNVRWNSNGQSWGSEADGHRVPTKSRCQHTGEWSQVRWEFVLERIIVYHTLKKKKEKEESCFPQSSNSCNKYSTPHRKICDKQSLMSRTEMDPPPPPNLNPIEDFLRILEGVGAKNRHQLWEAIIAPSNEILIETILNISMDESDSC